MKYELEQVVFYMDENHVHSAKVTSRTVVENVHDDLSAIDSPSKMTPFGRTGIRYQTCHGTWDEQQVFASKKELLEAL